MAENSRVEVFGIRHHGPGSARSLVATLAALRPDSVLIEGPADGTEALKWAGSAEMTPPVALLGYVSDAPRQAIYYPFAIFSPEWQAIRYANQSGIDAAFMDLSFAVQLALDEEAAERPAPAENTHREENRESRLANLRRDPLSWLAEAAGFSDGERWWEHMVEHRRGGGPIFAAILEAMNELRQESPMAADEPEAKRETLREAQMRSVIRAALAAGSQRIAVACGAWHAPALTEEALKRHAKTDGPLLKGLKKKNATVTWIPWTYGRLSSSSGYGAGVRSPGWYHHLWQHDRRVAEHWLTRVARLLRAEDLDASSAQTIEAVRLAEALAALRGRPLPGLTELNEASQAIFCFGGATPLALIHEKLVVGEQLGAVPSDAPMVPLQLDLQREQKRLRLKVAASQELLELDLRKENDLARSRLLHRLRLIDLPWGEVQRAGGKGTFKEIWKLQWRPEFVLALVEASAWGNTVSGAASAWVTNRAEQTKALVELIDLIGPVFLAELPAAAAAVMQALRDLSAQASDVTHLMRVLPPLGQLLRYGNVRQTDADMVSQVVSGLTARICAGLPLACGSLNDDAAAEMSLHIRAAQEAFLLLQEAQWTELWHGALVRLTELPHLHGLIAGQAVRFLYDAAQLDGAQTEAKLSLVLSIAADPAQAAAWLEGFLKDSGAVLIHDDALWRLIDDWVSGLSAESFQNTLPLLRRTFSTFQAPERRQLGTRVKQSSGSHPRASGSTTLSAGEDINTARAERVLPVLRQILGFEN